MTTVTPVCAVRARLLGMADARGHRLLRATVRLLTENTTPPHVIEYEDGTFVLASLCFSSGSLEYEQVRAVRVDPSSEIDG
jgi:hypothetical protein